ncbi:MAG: class I SAM-dependent methyltransferase [Spirochaetes bacterium]|nr:class I SAM-dependent methyltransferase [Spirochaetota bacterium]
MNYETVPCILCNSHNFTTLFSKPFENGENFNLVRCSNCGLEFVNPRPYYSNIHLYYKEYFNKRTDRGYNNYFSEYMRNEVLRLLTLNLIDLHFYDFERALGKEKWSLDIGCAAGYFVDYLTQRGWHAEGIDIAEDCIEFARNSLHVNAYCGDFLSYEFNKKYDCITMWATIEHLHYPDKFIEKIFSLLHNNGMLYISTCRSSAFSFGVLFGKNWRYYNFPHHLYFFSYRTLAKLLQLKGFAVTRFVTYGSGIGKPGSMIRKLADMAAKKMYLGDMMLVAAKKVGTYDSLHESLS